jgi:hypothetical protein
MLQLQVEKQTAALGMTASAIFESIVLGSAEGKTLALAVVLIEPIAAELLKRDFAHYECPFRCMPSIDDGYAIWMELGHPVLCLYRLGMPIHFQGITTHPATENFPLELQSIHLRLEMDGLGPAEPQFVIYADGPAMSAAAAPILQKLPWPSRMESRPAPVIPAQPWNLTPSVIRARREQARHWRRVRAIAAASVALYAIVVIGFFVHLIKLKFDIKALDAEIARDSSAAERVRGAMQRWDSMALAFEPELNPIFVLREVTNALPEDGVGFDKFIKTDYGISIEGEARTAGAASAYGESLKTLESLSAYNWATPNPQVQPTTLWKFKLEGKHAHAPIDEK